MLRSWLIWGDSPLFFLVLVIIRHKTALSVAVRGEYQWAALTAVEHIPPLWVVCVLVREHLPAGVVLRYDLVLHGLFP